jgi:hypothetical protein
MVRFAQSYKIDQYTQTPAVKQKLGFDFYEQKKELEAEAKSMFLVFQASLAELKIPAILKNK